MIISFGWTSPALVAHVLYTPEAQPIKTVTRREWVESHARRFTPGLVVDAWNTSPRNKARGADPHLIARIRIIGRPTPEFSKDPPAEDWFKEGFQWLTDHQQKVDGQWPHEIWKNWKWRPWNAASPRFVVRFEVIEVVDPFPALAILTPAEMRLPYDPGKPFVTS